MNNRIISVYIIIGLWIAIYIVGRFVDINPYLWGVGMKNLHGQFYRYITETFLHVNWVHLIANCLALDFGYAVGVQNLCAVSTGNMVW